MIHMFYGKRILMHPIRGLGSNSWCLGVPIIDILT
jgi:hypothetical protein